MGRKGGVRDLVTKDTYVESLEGNTKLRRLIWSLWEKIEGETVRGGLHEAPTRTDE